MDTVPHKGKSFPAYLGFLALLLVASIVYYGSIIDKLPFGIHNWAQGDRFALARHYFDNGLNFFMPGTYNLFDKDGITGVEFPIQAYLTACLGYIFGREQMHICFRLLDIAILWSGLIHLFRVVWERTGDFVMSLIPPMFIFCAPVFIYYSGNFLPDPAAVSVSFIAFYFLFRYLDIDSGRDLWIMLGWFTLAALIKTTLALFLIATLAVLFFRAIATGRRNHAIVLFSGGLVSGALILGWFLYSRHLSETHHAGTFLSSIKPFESSEQLSDYLNYVFKRYHITEYMLLAQYILLPMLLSAGIFLLRRYRMFAHLWLIGCYFLCAIVFFFLMGHQMLYHDYYIIAMFFPFAGYAVTASVIMIRRTLSDGDGAMALRLSAAVGMLLLFFFADHQSYKRLQPEYEALGHKDEDGWLEGGKELLDSLRIPRNEPIGVVGTNALNLSMIYFDRHGYAFPPVFFGECNIFGITQQLRERKVRILVYKEGKARQCLEADSSFFKDFRVLAIHDDKRVLELKN